MSARELHQTLAQAAGAVWAPPGSGLEVTELDLEMPLEVTVVADAGGNPVAVGGAPFTRWVSGVLPVVHRSRLRIQALDHDATGRDEP
jgi:hypothetical protein